MSASRVVGMGDLAVTRSSEDTLIACALGSCLGVAVYDPLSRSGGLLHAQLPLSASDRQKAQARPGMFVDSGLLMLLRSLLELGASRSTLIVCAAGGAHGLGDQRLFDIGRRNQAVLRKVLWKNAILIHAEDMGGTMSRTLSLEMATGRISLRRGGSTKALYAPAQSPAAQERRWLPCRTTC